MYSLVIDCSHKDNFFGLFNDKNNWLFEHKFSGQPFENLIENLKEVLAEYSIDKSEISHFYTSHSPGSTLGIRVSQMMIEGFLKTCCRSAKVTYYSGLHISALLLFEELKALNTVNYLITENGRHSWNVIKIDSDLQSQPVIHQYAPDALVDLEGDFFYIPQMKTWGPPTVETKQLEYSPDRFLGCIRQLNSLEIDTSFLSPSKNSYVKWNQY
ncbi:MAG: hypothetical protein P8I61_03590 [Opitutae bacterium]|nr:hypothetical protein [Opitutae bacterium]